jgi:hypothetical protein
VVAGFAPTWQQTAELAALVPFAHLCQDDLRVLAERGSYVNAAPGDVVMTQGEPGVAFYVIESGQVEVVRDLETVGTRGPGDTSARSRCSSTRPAPPQSAPPRRRRLPAGRDAFTTFVAAGFRRGTLRTTVLTVRDEGHR